MPVFAYRAFRSDGREVSGAVEAASRQEAAAQLQAGGLRPFHLSPVPGGAKSTGRRPFTWARKLNFARIFGELSVLLGAGFTVDKALRVVVEKESSPESQASLQKVLDLVTEGKPVSEAFACLADIPAEIAPLLASGERSGRIAEVCERLARIFEARAKRRTAIFDALTYPAFLVLVMIGALVVLSTVLIPALEPMFDGAPDAKPLTIRILSPLGDALVGFAPMLPLVALLALLAALLASKSARAKASFARMRMAIPLVGAFIRQVSVIRYLETLSLQLGNGVAMAEALRFAGAAAGNGPLGNALSMISEEVANGTALHRAMQKAGPFDRATLSLVAVGEEANRLPLVLDRATLMLETGLTRRIERSVAMLTPALTVILGLLIGSLVLSVMTTILSVNDLALPG